MKPLRDARAAIQEWLRAEGLNVASDVVPVAGDVGSFTVTYHANIGKGPSVGLSEADVLVRVYVSRAEEENAHLLADDAQTDLFGSLEAWSGPWSNLTIRSSSVAEEVQGEATYVVVRFAARLYL